MLRSALASWTLFFGLLLIMSGNGLQVVLLGTEATEAGFSKVTTGFVMAGYFLGIFCGSLLVRSYLWEPQTPHQSFPSQSFPHTRT